VPPQYDSLLAKLIVGGADRDGALWRLRGALARCRIDGVATNTGMHAALAVDEEFAAGGVEVGYLARWLTDAWLLARQPEAAGRLGGAPLSVRDAVLARGGDPPGPPQRGGTHG